MTSADPGRSLDDLAADIAAVNGGPIPDALVAEVQRLKPGEYDQLAKAVSHDPDVEQRRATLAALSTSRGDLYAAQRRQQAEAVAAAADPDTSRLVRAAAHTSRDRAELLTVAKVMPERVRWLWPKHIPLGKLTVLDGDPGLGKSTLTLDLAARVTTGSPLPDKAALDCPGAVLVVSAEDGVADTIRPRLAAAGADLERVTVLVHVNSTKADDTTDERPLVLPDDLAVLEHAILEAGAVLVVIDPFAAFLDVRVDSYKDQHVRRALMPLAKLAERTGAAIVIVRHLSKTGGANAVYRGGGSIGIIGAARAGLLVAPDPEDLTRRILAVTKSNLAQMPPALAYRLVPDDLHDCGRIQWEGPTKHRADELLATHTATDDLDETSALAAAVTFLEDVLADGDMPVQEVKDEAKAAGVKWGRTIERAKARLGVTSIKYGKPKDPVQGWLWHLPEGRQQRPEGRQDLQDESPGQAEHGQHRQGVGGVDGVRRDRESGEGR